MTSKTLLILGASGDLTERLLLPGIGSLAASSNSADAKLVQGLSIIGSGRSVKSDAQWRTSLRRAFKGVGATGSGGADLIAAARYAVADPTSPDDLSRLLALAGDDVIVYFALPPSIVKTVVDVLATLELPANTVLAFEKPFGSDARSAAALNRKLHTFIEEEQIHRVDHFLGMATVLNILGLRFANRLIEPMWNADNVELVEITYDEDLGLEGRAGYYDHAGALQDMLQSHLLQVLSVVAMEPPIGVDPINFRDCTAQVLRATAIWSGEPVFPGTTSPSRRARYTGGTIEGRSLPAYAKENGVDPDRQTETLAELVVEVNTRRWAGVPFVLKSGKAIGDAKKGIRLTLRPVRHVPDGLRGGAAPERIEIGMRPATVSFDLTMNGDGDPFTLDPHTIEATLDSDTVTPYGEVLRGVLGADATLSIRGDAAEQCWRIVAPAVSSWARGDVPLDEYRAGTRGPTAWRG